MKMFSFFITDENKKFLKELSQETKTNMSKIINSMINEASKKENFKNKNSDYNELENTPDSKIKIIKVRINENEYLKLKKLAVSEFLNVSRYIKFLISQKIYTDTNPANSQINEINQIRKDLLKIGVNINSIAKKINTDNYASNDLLNLLSETLKDIQKQDNTIKLKINSFASINKDRF